jgi:hypothetical protein
MTPTFRNRIKLWWHCFCKLHRSVESYKEIFCECGYMDNRRKIRKSNPHSTSKEDGGDEMKRTGEFYISFKPIFFKEGGEIMDKKSTEFFLTPKKR